MAIQNKVKIDKWAEGSGAGNLSEVREYGNAPGICPGAEVGGLDEGATAGILRNIWINSWPVLGVMLLNFVVGYTDVYVAGMLSPDVQAVVGFISQLYFILIILGNALGVGTVALVSSSVGRCEWGQAFDFTRQSLVMAASIGAILAVLSFAGAGEIILQFSLPEAIRGMALVYLKIFSFAMLPNYIIILMSAVFRAAGQPLIPFRVMGVVTVLNVASSFGLALGLGPLPRLGYRGIATATAISMLAGMLLVATVLFGRKWRGVWEGSWKPRAGIIRSILRISWPAAVLQLAWNAGSLALYQFLGKLGAASITAMAAYANGLRMESITYLPAFALNMAAAVLVGQSLGAGSVERARRYGWQTAAAGTVVLSLFAALLAHFAPRLAGMLTEDPAVKAETIRYLYFNLAAAPLMVFSVVLGGAMQGAGDTMGVMKIIVFAIWIVRIPLAAFFCFTLGFGATGVWGAMFCSLTLQGALMTWKYWRGGWIAAAIAKKA
jgi:putative MATE family efflux protein